MVEEAINLNTDPSSYASTMLSPIQTKPIVQPSGLQ